MNKPIDIAELMKLEAAAEPGPWTAEESCIKGWGWDIPELEDADYRDSRFMSKGTVEFIVAIRNAAKALLAEVAEHRSGREVTRLKSINDRLLTCLEEMYRAFQEKPDQDSALSEAECLLEELKPS